MPVARATSVGRALRRLARGSLEPGFARFAEEAVYTLIADGDQVFSAASKLR